MATTARGFAVGAFLDDYGAKCSIQKSSLATEDCIWLGMDEGQHVDGHCCARMHLTRAMVRRLLPALEHFAATGDLPPARPRTGGRRRG